MMHNEYPVLIAGAGPAGMMLAGELALADVDCIIVERRQTHELDGSRAGGLHARTIEVLDQRGIADRFLTEGKAMQIQGFGGTPLDISDFPTRHNYGLALWQKEFERILAGWIAELDVPILRGREVIGFTQDADGVDVTLAEAERIDDAGAPAAHESLSARYLVGCDGGRSLVRKTAGIEFPGWDATTSWIIAHVEMTDRPEIGVRPEGGGIGPVDRFGDGSGPYGVVLKERDVAHSGDPTFEEFQEALIAAYGTDFGAHSPIYLSRFTDATRQAATYRSGRVLLAGDAAHIHPPQGGQGLNIGVQDAVNLGWKLAQVVHGTSGESLLDTYHAERHPVAARVLRTTMAQVALATPDDRHDALRETIAELLATDDARRHMAGMMSGLDIHYDLGGTHPLAGRRMPDLDIETDEGPTRVYTLLHEARPLLLDFTNGELELARWANRIRTVRATYDGAWELPVLGTVSAPTAVLIRPDGYVAWVGVERLSESVDRWCGRCAADHRNRSYQGID